MSSRTNINLCMRLTPRCSMSPRNEYDKKSSYFSPISYIEPHGREGFLQEKLSSQNKLHYRTDTSSSSASGERRRKTPTWRRTRAKYGVSATRSHSSLIFIEDFTIYCHSKKKRRVTKCSAFRQGLVLILKRTSVFCLVCRHLFCVIVILSLDCIPSFISREIHRTSCTQSSF